MIVDNKIQIRIDPYHSYKIIQPLQTTKTNSHIYNQPLQSITQPMPHQAKFIIIEGAQSTGKTTLINQIKQLNPQIPIIKQIARSVIKRQNISNEQLQSNSNNCFCDLQFKIFQAQFQKQSQHHSPANHPYLLDRCTLSPLVYSIYYFPQNTQLITKIQSSKQFLNSINTYKDSLLILLHPQKQILKDDGVRKQATFEELQEITKIYKRVMNKHGVKYVEVKGLKGRLDIVMEMINGLRQE